MIKVCKEEVKVDNNNQTVWGEWVQKINNCLAPPNTKTLSSSEKRLNLVEECTVYIQGYR